MNTSLTSQPADGAEPVATTGTDSIAGAIGNPTDNATADEGSTAGSNAGTSDAAAPALDANAPAAGPTSARALLKSLQQQFAPFRDCLPLSIGIDKQILAQVPGIDRKLMRAALGIHTGSQRYLRTMENATVRFNLDGSKGAEVTDVHRKHAKDTLQERFRKEAERKKAERDAAAEEESNRRRQEKLEQLTAKFSRKG